MSWLRIDDGFIENDKVAALTDRELRVWLRILCRAARQRTAIVKPAATQELVGLTNPRLERFADAGLLDTTDDGYEIHDWEIYNPAKLDPQELDERVAETVERFPAASANELAAIIGGRRKETLAAIKRFRGPPGTGSGNQAGTTWEPAEPAAGSGSGNHLGTGSARARARDARSRARVPRPVPVNQEPRAVPAPRPPAPDDNPWADPSPNGNLDPHAELAKIRADTP